MVAPWTALEDVTAGSGANNDGSLSNDRPNLKFNPEFNPNALVGKATCIQLKPAGRIVCFDWQYFQIWQGGGLNLANADELFLEGALKC